MPTSVYLDDGGSGTPGGSPTELQFNDSGSFGGVTGSAVDGSGNLTILDLDAVDVTADTVTTPELDAPAIATEAITVTGTLGPELVTNGDFSSATGWTVGTGWAIAGGTATHTPGNTAALSQAACVPVAGQNYEVQVVIDSQSAGLCAVQIGGASSDIIGAEGATTWSAQIRASDTTAFSFIPDTDYDGVFASVSVKHLPDLIAWTSASAGGLDGHIDGAGNIEATSIDVEAVITNRVEAEAYFAGDEEGVTAGPFTTITSITVTNGIITALTGS